jgi:hypothetical protein
MLRRVMSPLTLWDELTRPEWMRWEAATKPERLLDGLHKPPSGWRPQASQVGTRSWSGCGTWLRCANLGSSPPRQMKVSATVRPDWIGTNVPRRIGTPMSRTLVERPLTNSARRHREAPSPRPSGSSSCSPARQETSSPAGSVTAAVLGNRGERRVILPWGAGRTAATGHVPP